MTKGTATRRRITEAALRAASAEGLAGISLGRLAAELGMSKSGLFAHFDSKEALQLDVLAAAAGKFEQTVVRPALEVPGGEARIRDLFDRWLRWDRHESMPGGCVFIQATAELDGRPGPAREALIAHQVQWLDTLSGAARLAVERGELRPGLDPELFAFQLHGTLLAYHHAARLLQHPRAEAWARQSFETQLARGP